MSDPEYFVNEFTKKVDEWQEWYGTWKSYAKQGSGVPGETCFRALDEWTVRRFDDMEQLLKTQNQVNIMMLAVIDDLKIRLSKQEAK